MADEELNDGEFDPPVPSLRVKGVNGVLFVLGLAWAGGTLTLTRGSDNGWIMIAFASPGVAQAALSYAAVYHPRKAIARLASLLLLMVSVFLSLLLGVAIFIPYVAREAALPLACEVSLAIICACCFRTNWAWGRTLSEWDARCRAAGPGTAAGRARRSTLRVSLREALGVTCFVALLLGIARVLAVPVPPPERLVFYHHVRREHAPVEPPADASEIRFSQRALGPLEPGDYDLVLEFTCSEESFRQWRPEGTTKGVTPLPKKEILRDFMDRKFKVDRGLQQYHQNGGRSAFDLDTGRAYYHR